MESSCLYPDHRVSISMKWDPWVVRPKNPRTSVRGVSQSDDRLVYSRGRAAEEALEKIAEEKGGKYQIYLEKAKAFYRG